ncbi:ubiquitin-like protein ATG12 [Ceratobasidium sp. AG-Ba]|nr:ubiquitin-like protein ATG12 [Ceratobasidium sp. AG-Ba]
MSTALDALETSGKQPLTKVIIQFKAVGNAPVMRKNDFGISSTQSFRTVIKFLRDQLGLKANDPLFTYINLSFAPTPDENILNLFKSFAVGDKLIVNYW